MRIVAILGALLLSGCMHGLLYENVTEPLTIDFHNTPVGDGFSGKSDVKEVRYNFYARVIWDENSIGSIAKEAGFSEIYYADLQTFSILGIWNQYRVRVYGLKEVPAP